MATTRAGSRRRLALAAGLAAVLLAAIGAAPVAADTFTRYPTSNALVTQPDPWLPLVNPNNAHADDGVYASGDLTGKVIGGERAPAEFAQAYGDFGFDAIPANAVITSVTAQMQYKFAQTGALALEYEIVLFTGSDAFSGTVLSFAQGTSEPTTDTVLATTPVAATRDQLLDGALGVEVSATAGYGPTQTMLIDYVSVTVTYTVPEPRITVPADITVATARAAGANVSFEVTAIDDQDGPLTPTCTPPSGSLFPVGTTTVDCTVTDSDQNTATASFTVTVVRTPAPSMPATSTIAPTTAAPPLSDPPLLLLAGVGLAAFVSVLASVGGLRARKP